MRARAPASPELPPASLGFPKEAGTGHTQEAPAREVSITKSLFLNFLGDSPALSSRTMNSLLLRNCAQGPLCHLVHAGTSKEPMPVLPRELKYSACPGEMGERNLSTTRSIIIFNKYILLQPRWSIPSYAFPLQI